jgi:hypothetical protein
MNSECWAVCFAKWSREQENDVASYQTSISSKLKIMHLISIEGFRSKPLKGIKDTLIMT